ncbi:protein ABHD13-like [Mizuhopecten yessoensis]|uniref:Protein ABHD13 n=1 Tax=Mizuhopecten yessoensis TaxID=6573 RepID=A0A210PIJ5_MIZYE|nr:protein ABHD13-like [Mizuhopecten yessoensis]OWF36310.1 Alpha/beta hydrolase domain-containing protein 13 [Mizuhopecten yessoensis]
MTENVDIGSANRIAESELDTNSPEMGKGFRTIEWVTRLIFAVVMRFWKLCTSAALILLLAFWTTGGVVTFLLLIFALIGLFYNAQDMLLYYPDQPPQSRLFVQLPNTINLPYENHFIRTSDNVRINVVLIKHTHANAPTVIYFHGNAGNIGHRLVNSHGFFTSCGVNVLLVEYRGYGKSEGSPSETGLYRDAEAAINFLLGRNDINSEKIVVFGRSLGGAVAVWLAAQPFYAQHIAALVVENTFTSLPEIGRTIFNFKLMELLPQILFKHKYPSAERIKKIKLPTLFLSGQADDLIPPKMMTKLHQVSGSGMKRIHRFDQGTHNETWMCSGYYEAFLQFLKDVILAKSVSQAQEQSRPIVNNFSSNPNLTQV